MLSSVIRRGFTIFVMIIIMVTGYTSYVNNLNTSAHNRMEEIYNENEFLFEKYERVNFDIKSDCYRDISALGFHTVQKEYDAYLLPYDGRINYPLFDLSAEYGLLFSKDISHLPHWIEYKRIGDTNWYTYRELL